MLRILKDTIETLRKTGYECGFKVGEKWVTADNTDSQCPLFLFDPLTYKEDPYDFSKDYTLKFVIGFRNNQDEEDEVMNVETVEYCEIVLQQFLIALTNYVSSTDQRIITMETDINVTQFHDLSVYALPMSGLIVTAYVKKSQTNQC